MDPRSLTLREVAPARVPDAPGLDPLDELTGVASRAAFEHRASELIAATGEEDRFSLLVLDVDRFGEVNEVLGREAGDALLRQIAGRLSGVLRGADDAIARIAGDRFAVLIGNSSGPEAGLAVARRLSESLERDFVVAGVPFAVTASVGIARYPADGVTPELLIRCAGGGVEAAKALRAGQHEGGPSRLRRLGELRQALKRADLVLHYQPQIELGSRRVRGVEALVRLEHPEHGVLSAGDFIPLAEQTGLINPLTTQVLRTALEQLREWLDAGEDLTMSVNVPQRSVLDDDFAEDLAELLSACRIEPRRLCIELTEDTIVADPERAAQRLAQLDALGVRIALDNFGSGCSSLLGLRALPIHELKIDVVGEDDPAGQAIVQAMTALAHSLGASVVLKGLETPQSLERAAASGADAVQGYALGRPMDAQALIGWIAARD